jgi:transposase
MSVCHFIRAADRNSLGTAAQRTGLGIGDDGLAATARLAAGGCLGPDPRDALGPSAGHRPDGLVAGLDRFVLRARGAWWKKTGPNPTDRGKSGSKHHLLTDAQGIVLAAEVTAANVHDVRQLLPLVNAVPPIRGKRGRPRRRPRRVHGDRAYDSRSHRRELRRLGIEPVLAKRNTEHGSGLGQYRWVVERTIAWLHQFRRLRVRYERRDDIHQAFLTIGSIVTCTYFL